MNDILAEFLISETKEELTEKVLKNSINILGISSSVFYFVENNELVLYEQKFIIYLFYILIYIFIK